MWVLCSTKNDVIFDPVICDSKEEVLDKMNSDVEIVAILVKESKDNEGRHCYNISSTGMSYQIFAGSDVWSWKIFNFVMKVAK